jgi:hypothetical protein
MKEKKGMLSIIPFPNQTQNSIPDEVKYIFRLTGFYSFF